MIDLDKIRKDFNNMSVKEQEEFCDLIQGQGLRLCPRNIYKDIICEKICKNPCRKRFWTCFKKYYKEKENENTRKQ